MKKPNVLFILSDQHNAKALSSNGHPDVRTPRLDRLAGEGVYFSNAISQNPICTPSRVSWISGQYCHNHGYYGLEGPNPGGLPTIFGHFKKSGYKTAAYGKIHCPEYWVEDDTDEFTEIYADCSIAGGEEYRQYLIKKNLLEIEDSFNFHEHPNHTGLNGCDARASLMPYEDSVEGYCVQRGTDFIKRCNDEGAPFFLHVSLPRPHSYYTPSEPFWSMYDDKELTLPPNLSYDMDAAKKAPNLIAMAEVWRSPEWPLFEPRTVAAATLRKYHGYLGAVSQVDHSVGLLVDLIDSLGIGDDTIIIYGSDHGDYSCEHGIMEKAPGICSDAITRVPMIWRWGERFARRRVNEIVENVDMVSTVCTLCGLPQLETGDGTDLAPVLYGGAGDASRCGLTEFAFSKSLRRGDFRFVFYTKDYFRDAYPDGFGELYNLKEDPWEMRNLYFEREYAETVREMQNELLQMLVRTARPVTSLSADLRKTPQNRLRFHNYVDGDTKFNLHKAKKRGNSYL